jgi:DNA-binding transcriptional MerR regulator
MADFRQIHVLIWDDDWFCQLSSDDKVVFIWLFSNRRASVSGLYQFTEFICSRETGIPIENVRKAIKHLVDDKKIYVEGEWVWVKNLRKYNYYKNDNADKRIQKDLDQLPDNGLKHAYIAYYKPLTSPLQAPATPLLEQEQEHDIEHEHENKNEKEVYINENSPVHLLFSAFVTGFKREPYSNEMDSWIRELSIMANEGVQPEDIKQAFIELDGRYSITSPKSVKTASITCKNKRINPKPTNKKDKPLDDLKFDNIGDNNGN